MHFLNSINSLLQTFKVILSKFRVTHAPYDVAFAIKTFSNTVVAQLVTAVLNFIIGRVFILMFSEADFLKQAEEISSSGLSNAEIYWNPLKSILTLRVDSFQAPAAQCLILKLNIIYSKTWRFPIIYFMLCDESGEPKKSSELSNLISCAFSQTVRR